MCYICIYTLKGAHLYIKHFQVQYNIRHSPKVPYAHSIIKFPLSACVLTELLKSKSSNN